MKNIKNFLAQPKVVTISFVGMLISLVVFYYFQQYLGAKILDVLPGYNLSIVNQSMVAFGDFGRNLYAFLILTLDVIFPIFYVSFFSGFILLMIKKGILRQLYIIPIILGIVDIMENIQIFTMLITFPDIFAEQAEWSSKTTLLKNWLANLTYLAILLALSVRFFDWAIKKNN